MDEGEAGELISIGSFALAGAKLCCMPRLPYGVQLALPGFLCRPLLKRRKQSQIGMRAALRCCFRRSTTNIPLSERALLKFS
jgi:hypothetical protein